MYIINLGEKNTTIVKYNKQKEIVKTFQTPTIGFKHNQISNISESLTMFKNIDKFFKKENLKNEEITLSLSSKNIKSKKIEKSIVLKNVPITKELIQSEIENKDNKELTTIHSIPFKYEINSQENVLNPIGLFADTFKIHYYEFSIETKILEELKSTFKKLGIHITTFVMDVYAEVLNIAKKNYSLISIFNEHIVISEVYNNNITNFIKLDIGFEVILEDLKKGLKIYDNDICKTFIKTIGVPFDEKYKDDFIVEYNNKTITVSINFISEIILARVSEILKDIINENLVNNLHNIYIMGAEFQNIKNINKILNFLDLSQLKILDYQINNGILLFNNNIRNSNELKIKNEKEENLEEIKISIQNNNSSKENTQKQSLWNKIINFI